MIKQVNVGAVCFIEDFLNCGFYIKPGQKVERDKDLVLSCGNRFIVVKPFKNEHKVRVVKCSPDLTLTNYIYTNVLRKVRNK